MINKNVCPNCGQLYDTGLERCPLCGAAAQVLETAPTAQRRRITEQERRQRRDDRKAAEQEARRRRRDEMLARDAEEERQLEEEERARREARLQKRLEKKRRKEEERQALDRQRREELPHPLEQDEPMDRAKPYVTVPRQAGYDRGRVPRAFLVMSTLLLAITLAVGGSYLLWRTGLAKLPVYDKLAAQKESRPAAQPPVETQPPAAQTEKPAETGSTEVPIPRAECTGITLDLTEITFSSAGDTRKITATVEPEGCTQRLEFSTADDTVAKVGMTGVVTSIGEGSTVITATCGSITAQCTVTCTIPTEAPKPTEAYDGELKLKTDDITFFEAGENFVLILVDLPADIPVVWSSEDETIATVDSGGHVVAVGKGTTKIVAEAGGKKVSCIVRCNFREG